MIKESTTKYIALKPIRYKNPNSPAYGRIITPDDNLVLTFPHLDTKEVDKLIDSGTIAKLSTKEVKRIGEIREQMEIDRQGELDQKSAVYLAQKKQAMEKMKNAL